MDMVVLTMILLLLFLFLHPVPFHCKLILSSNTFELVQNEKSQSHAEILNTSLQRFDNFTLCARYRIVGYPKGIIFKIPTFCQVPHLQLLDIIGDKALPGSIHI